MSDRDRDPDGGDAGRRPRPRRRPPPDEAGRPVRAGRRGAAVVLLDIDDPTVIYTARRAHRGEDPAKELNADVGDDRRPGRDRWSRWCWRWSTRCPTVASVLAASCWSGSRSSLGFLVWNYADQTGTARSRWSTRCPARSGYAVRSCSARSPACLCERAGRHQHRDRGPVPDGRVLRLGRVASFAYSAEMGPGRAASPPASRWRALLARLRAALPGQPGRARRRADRARDRPHRLPAQPDPRPTRRSEPVLNEPLTLDRCPSRDPGPVLGRRPLPISGPRADAVQPDAARLPDVRLGRASSTFLLFQTRWGLRVRSVGEHPKAADTVGIKVNRLRWQAVLLGGVFAGLGGAYFTVGSTGAFDSNMPPPATASSRWPR